MPAHGAVQLPAAVVGKHDAVAAGRERALGIVRAQDAFQQQLPRPEVAKALHVVPAERRVEHAMPDEGIDVAPGSELALDIDEARAARCNRREPARMHQDVEPGAQREPLLRQQAGAQVALALPGDREVARQHQALEAGLERAPHDRLGDAPLREHVGLQP